MPPSFFHPLTMHPNPAVSITLVAFSGLLNETLVAGKNEYVGVFEGLRRLRTRLKVHGQVGMGLVSMTALRSIIRWNLVVTVVV